jgi:hypothetical protein
MKMVAASIYPSARHYNPEDRKLHADPEGLECFQVFCLPSLFWKIKIGLWYLHAVRLWIPLISFWTPEPIFNKPGMYITTPESSQRRTSYIPSSNLFLCMYVSLSLLGKRSVKPLPRQRIYIIVFLFCNPILFAICTNIFSKLCKQRIQWHVEECSVALLCN